MINQISISKIKETIYALSALNMKLNDPALPGPLGLSDSAALDILIANSFSAVCTALDKEELPDHSVELPGDYRKAVEQVVTDMVLATLTHKEPTKELLCTLKSKTRSIPPGHGFY